MMSGQAQGLACQRKAHMKNSVVVAGVGMVPFAKPSAAQPYPVMASEAVRLALQDAGLGYAEVQQAYVGYVYGDSTAGQRALYEVGMTGIPVVNVNNNCATGSSALVVPISLLFNCLFQIYCYYYYYYCRNVNDTSAHPLSHSIC